MIGPRVPRIRCRTATAFLAFLVALAWVVCRSGIAAAQDLPGVHDGVALKAVFLRAALGGGMAIDPVESDVFSNRTLPADASFRGTLKAFGVAGQLEIGYSVRPGLALGAGVYLQQIGSPRAADITLNNAASKEVFFRYDYRFESSLLTLVAPFVDWYPFPSLGLHVEGAVGLGILTLGKGQNVDVTAAPRLSKMHGNGLLVMAGLGYEFWMSSSCSMGLLVRMMAGSGKTEGPDGLLWANQFYVPAILLTATAD